MCPRKKASPVFLDESKTAKTKRLDDFDFGIDAQFICCPVRSEFVDYANHRDNFEPNLSDASAVRQIKQVRKAHKKNAKGIRDEACIDQVHKAPIERSHSVFFSIILHSCLKGASTVDA